MTAIIVANSIAAAVVIGGLAVAMRLGHLTAGGRFERTLRRFELHRGRGERPQATLRRVA
jgi:hypothetical protein